MDLLLSYFTVHPTTYLGRRLLVTYYRIQVIYQGNEQFWALVNIERTATDVSPAAVAGARVEKVLSFVLNAKYLSSD